MTVMAIIISLPSFVRSAGICDNLTVSFVCDVFSHADSVIAPEEAPRPGICGSCSPACNRNCPTTRYRRVALVEAP